MLGLLHSSLISIGVIALSLSSLLPCASLSALAQNAPTETPNSLRIQSITVNAKPVSLRRNEVDLGPFPENIAFFFSPSSNSIRPLRIRYKFEGVDSKWRDGPSFMTLTARFFNTTGDQVGQNTFSVNGESAGWTGSLKTSPLTHRREAVAVPPQASHLWIVISSAGPPETVGVYVVANLVVCRSCATQAQRILN
jgi:hypothetical protein